MAASPLAAKYSVDHEDYLELIVSGAKLRAATTQEMTVAAAEQQPRHLLVMSGGGAWGAWGSGLLAGWADATRQATSAESAAPPGNEPAAEHPRPYFRVVTGVSTGALMATHAFLGTAADDVALREAYTGVNNDDIFKISPYRLFFGDAVANSSGLRRLTKKQFDDATIDRVAEAISAGDDAGVPRALFLGTTCLDTGAQVIWNAGEIARDARLTGSPKLYDLYRDVVYASAAIPVLFQPAYIEGRMYVDGGATQNAILKEWMFEKLKEDDGERVYILVNGRPGLRDVPTPRRVLPIALRSAAVLMQANMRTTFLEILSAAADSKRRVFYTFIPADAELSDEHGFQEESMRKMYVHGYTYGGDGPWQAAKRETLVKDIRATDEPAGADQR